MAEISKIEYAARTQAVAKAATDFGLAWRQLSSACDAFGISKDEFAKKAIMDNAICDFLEEFNKRLGLVIDGLSKGDEDDG